MTLLVATEDSGFCDEVKRNFVGSIQLDYLHLLGKGDVRDSTFDNATVELSLKVTADFSARASASVKVCFACHGFELGMAYFDFRISDQANFRVGRFTPAFGEFPLRHDPANHQTSDKPLPYDMGRMVHLQEWNMSILPAPWVDNGIELNGTVYFGARGQLDYAAYAIAGPSGSDIAVDFDFIEHRSLYYVDANSQPAVGGRAVTTASILGGDVSASLGASGMYGTYDPDKQLEFLMLGGDASLTSDWLILRAEALWRRTQMFLGADPSQRFRYGPKPDGTFDDFFVKDGFYTEAEVPLGPVGFVARWDGLRRRGNVLQTSELAADSSILRYTAALAWRFDRSLRLKVSAEHYDFSDFDDVRAVHVGVVGAF